MEEPLTDDKDNQIEFAMSQPEIETDGIKGAEITSSSEQVGGSNEDQGTQKEPTRKPNEQVSANQELPAESANDVSQPDFQASEGKQVSERKREINFVKIHSVESQPDLMAEAEEGIEYAEMEEKRREVETLDEAFDDDDDEVEINIEEEDEMDSINNLLLLLESKDQEVRDLTAEVTALKEENERVRACGATGLSVIPEEDGSREQLMGEINYLNQQLEEAGLVVEEYEKQIAEMETEMEQLKNANHNQNPEGEKVILESKVCNGLESVPETQFSADDETTPLNDEITSLRAQVLQLQGQLQNSGGLRQNSLASTVVSEENDELKSTVAMLAAANEGLKEELKMMRGFDESGVINTSSNSNSGNEGNDDTSHSSLNHAKTIGALEIENQNLQTELLSAEKKVAQLQQQVLDMEKDLKLKDDEIERLTKDYVSKKRSLKNDNVAMKIEIQNLKTKLVAEQIVNEKLQLDLTMSQVLEEPSVPVAHGSVSFMGDPNQHAFEETTTGLDSKREEPCFMADSDDTSSSSASFDESVHQLLASISRKPPISYNGTTYHPRSYKYETPNPQNSISSSCKCPKAKPLPTHCVQLPKAANVPSRSQTFSELSSSKSEKPVRRTAANKPMRPRVDIPVEYNRHLDEFSKSTQALLQSMYNVEARLQRKDMEMRHWTSSTYGGTF